MIDETLIVDPLENQYSNDKSPAANWLQTPPSQMPWGVPLANQPTIMRFTGDSCLPIPNPMGYTNPAFEMKETTDLSFREFRPMKRKNLNMTEKYEDPRPAKQLITEDKMAANLDSLHISNNYVAHQCGTMNADELPGNSTTAQQSPQENHMPTLVLCDELRRLTAEAVIPPAVIAKLERPTNALVLWKPPAGTLSARLQQIVDACKGPCNQGKSSSWASFTSNNNNTTSNNNNNYPSCTEDMNDPDSNKERQDSRNTAPEDSLMEL